MIPALFLAALLAAKEPTKPLEPRLPKLSSVFPQGSGPGAKLRVEVLGEFVDRAQSVVFLDPAIHGSVAESTYTRLALDFTVASDAPLGEHYFRVVTPRGASNILLFRIGDLPHILEKEPNSTFDQAQEVTPPVTINGRLNVDGDFDFYRFQTGKGQNWIFDLRASSGTARTNSSGTRSSTTRSPNPALTTPWFSPLTGTTIRTSLTSSISAPHRTSRRFPPSASTPAPPSKPPSSALVSPAAAVSGLMRPVFRERCSRCAAQPRG